MVFPFFQKQPDTPSPASPPPPPPPPSPPNPTLHLHQAFSTLHTNCNSFFQHLHSSFHRHFPSPKPNPNPNPLQSALSFLQPPPSAARSPAWARISSPSPPAPNRSVNSTDAYDLDDRLSGVVVYSLCNSNENFVLISGPRSKASMSFFFFAEDDADSLLQQMKSIDPRTSSGTKVVAVPLNKVYKLKADGVAFRFVPQMSQIKNAVQEMQRAGYKGSFSGVPVFQSESLVLKGQEKSYRPVFFRKEDLEDILRKAYGVSGNLTPAPKQVDIQVGAFEEIMSVMKDPSSKWDDVVFIPPGFDIGSDPSRIGQTTSS